MKNVLIVIAVIDLLLLFAAGVRFATSNEDTEPLITKDTFTSLTSFSFSSGDDEDEPGFGEEGTTGGEVSNHLKGRAWEAEETSGMVGGGRNSGGGRAEASTDQFNRAEKVLDNRDDDLKGAKKKMGSLVGGDDDE